MENVYEKDKACKAKFSHPPVWRPRLSHPVKHQASASSDAALLVVVR
jgi:hypothetical protein